MRTIFWVSLFFSVVLIFLAHHPAIIEGRLTVGNPLLGSGAAAGGEEGQLDFTAVLGGLVVFVFYFMKFGRWPGPAGAPPGFRPKPTRHFTTWLRYVGWAMVYGLFMLFCYLLILFFPQLFANFLDAYLGIGISGSDTDLLQRVLNAVKEQPDSMVPYAVIIVTVVWSGAFAEVERNFRRNLQESALIPTEANRLIDKYETHPEFFSAEPAVTRNIVRESPFKLISEETFSGPTTEALCFRFAQCEYMLEQISGLRSKRYFARVLARYQEDFDEAKVEINKLRSKLQNYKLEIIETMRSAEDTPLQREAMTLADVNRRWAQSHDPLPFERRYFQRTWEQLERDTTACLRAILRIVICAVLAIGKSPYQRNALLKKFGLVAADDIGPVFNREYTVRAGLVIFVTMLLCSGVYYGVDSFRDGRVGNCPLNVPIPSSLAEIMFWTVYTVMIHLLGIFGGYSVQKWLSEEQRQFDDSPPDGLRLSDLATCFTFGFCLNIFLFALLLFPAARWSEFQGAWLWALMGGVTAAFTGFYMSRSSRLHEIQWRSLALQGLVTALLAFGVALFVYDLRFLRSPAECPALTAYIVYLLATTSLIGAALSTILQEWIRADQRGKRSRKGQWTVAAGPTDDAS